MSSTRSQVVQWPSDKGKHGEISKWGQIDRQTQTSNKIEIREY